MSPLLMAPGTQRGKFYWETSGAIILMWLSTWDDDILRTLFQVFLSNSFIFLPRIFEVLTVLTIPSASLSSHHGFSRNVTIQLVSKTSRPFYTKPWICWRINPFTDEGLAFRNPWTFYENLIQLHVGFPYEFSGGFVVTYTMDLVYDLSLWPSNRVP